MEEANEAVNDLKKDMQQFKQMNRGSFFKFDKLYFPIIARWLFIVAVILIALGTVVGFLGSLVGMQLLGAIFALIGGLISIVAVRIWFELILVVFNINDAVQELRENKRK